MNKSNKIRHGAIFAQFKQNSRISRKKCVYSTVEPIHEKAQFPFIFHSNAFPNHFLHNLSCFEQYRTKVSLIDLTRLDLRNSVKTKWLEWISCALIEFTHKFDPK